MTVQEKALSEIPQEALEVLSKEIGIANTIRFINQFTMGYGDYTQEREQIFEDMTLDEILNEIKKVRNQSKLSFVISYGLICCGRKFQLETDLMGSFCFLQLVKARKNLYVSAV